MQYSAIQMICTMQVWNWLFYDHDYDTSRPERKKSGSEEGPGVNSAHVGCRGGEGAVSDVSSWQPGKV